MGTQPFLIAEGEWIPIRDGNVTGMNIFLRHYTARQKRKVYQFVGPGDKEVYLTPDARALFVWRKFISDAGEDGVNCAVFRNEGTSAGKSSDLIRTACAMAWKRWPGQRLYTYVWPEKLHTIKRHGREMCPWPPGRCFIEAGFRFCGMTKEGKHVLELFPENLQCSAKVIP